MIVQALIKFDQNKWVILGQELTEKNREIENLVTTLAAPRRGLV
jgi:hypothetical protein